MNNSQITLEVEEIVDISPILRQRATELEEIINAFENVKASDYWKLLQTKVFNGVVDVLNHKIRNEKNPTEIYRLQGQIGWAEKYCDIDKLSQAYKQELINLRKKLNGQSN